MEVNDAIAPFVLKTYQMVNDPSSDYLIRWGKADNSFIVVDSSRFSQCLLPAFFKHSNFSSFIRQLNTYGFRKVDPDKCEFANEWFLRGQVHLLKNIGRKKQSNSRGNVNDEEDGMVVEIARLKEEQKVLEKEMVGMRKRLEATERRPKQIMALLCQVAEDPQILTRMMLETKQKRLVEKKKQRTSPASSSGVANSVKSDECEESRVDESFAKGALFWRSSTVADAPLIRFPTNKAGGGGGSFDTDHGSGPVGSDVRPPPPYPFSLLGGGF
ncbi:heat stress transcription factor C-1 [Lactuca sativa]|uniref:HSF-type DNA-binding domain-containing protein n=1 Tax=Lactuca sativa TaxID=4236 RepID=A0A9R1X140_LACSA|nr:heat stress transcription factor C-1 [Lactuca sativa]KAJ0194379.1 hypothetical protein LSAT_V11C800426850 [Lactuca sativa]